MFFERGKEYERKNSPGGDRGTEKIEAQRKRNQRGKRSKDVPDEEKIPT